VQENACEQAKIIVFGFSSDWLRKWYEHFLPIRERRKAKPKQTQHYFQHSIENCSNCQPNVCINDVFTFVFYARVAN